MRKFIIYLLFFVSYAPLAFYLSIANFRISKDASFSHPISQLMKEIFWNWGTVWFLFAIVAMVLFFVIFNSIKKTAPNTENVEYSKEQNIDFLSYLITYFFVFFDLKFETTNEIIGFSILFLFIAFVYTKSDLIYSNPVLLLFGYSIYRITTDGSRKVMVIAKESVPVGSNIPFIKLSRSVYFYKS